MDPLLSVSDLRVRYPDGTEALRGVSFQLHPAQRVAMVGPNGAGKTTLLLAIMRAVGFSGRVVIDGLEAGRRNEERCRNRCGMTFQDADDQLFMPTLLEDVAFGPLNQGLSAGDACLRADGAIAAVGLSGLEGRPAHHLSGGQKRLAALATILSMNVKLLLLDEPAAGLDHRSRKRVTEILARRDEATLLATHDLELAGRLCRRVIVLDEGRIVGDGTAEQILNDFPLLSAHGLA
jgi:cobalt/nickel transport system ATP-binding protein